VRRITRPGGLLIVHAPNFNGLPARLRGPDWHQIEPLVHLYYYTATTLSSMLQKNGFRVIGRFNLVSASGWKAHLQRGLGNLGIYLDNGLGIVTRADKPS